MENARIGSVGLTHFEVEGFKRLEIEGKCGKEGELVNKESLKDSTP
jgi:hypothetical protein